MVSSAQPGNTGPIGSPGPGMLVPDSPDPQRAVSTGSVSRSGPSGLIVIGNDGFIDADVTGETGFYVDDMRIVSQLLILIDGRRPVARSVRQNNLLTHFNFAFEPIGPGLTLEIDYTLDDTTVLGELRFVNAGQEPRAVEMAVSFAADHFDTFYVRFPPRPKRGTLHPAKPNRHGQSIQYDRLDGRASKSFVRISEPPRHDSDGTMRLTRLLRPEERWDVAIQAGFTATVPRPNSWRRASGGLERTRHRVFADATHVSSENTRLSAWLTRSVEGLSVMTAELDTGFYPYGGLPWFAVPFGRDGLIAGFQTLAIHPSIMRGVLRFHAKHQARAVDPFRQATPGKILHEQRRGETSATGLNPFSEYYGSVDTTPLFAMAVGAYWHRTNDRDLLVELWPHVDLALRWLSDFGDIDGDAFIEYGPDPGRGLVNQGWKDSSDSIVHEDGSIAQGLIALCEVQGYAYAAWRAGEELAAELGFEERARFCKAAADRLYQRFNEVFWQPDMGVYALALDGDKKPCRVRASNMAHLPWCGITPLDRGKLVLEELLSDRLFSGWGIRTLAAGELRYRPELYHRGPCWPHEMAIASWSAEAVGDNRAVRTLAEALLDTAEAFRFLPPELFCGYPREPSTPPIPYKSANPLQSWAAGAGCGMLASALGLRFDLPRQDVSVDLSGFPADWAPAELRNLAVGDERMTLRMEPDRSGRVGLKVTESHRHRIVIRDRGADKDAPA